MRALNSYPERYGSLLLFPLACVKFCGNIHLYNKYSFFIFAKESTRKTPNTPTMMLSLFAWQGNGVADPGVLIGGPHCSSFGAIKKRSCLAAMATITGCPQFWGSVDFLKSAIILSFSTSILVFTPSPKWISRPPLCLPYFYSLTRQLISLWVSLSFFFIFK